MTMHNKGARLSPARWIRIPRRLRRIGAQRAGLGAAAAIIGCTLVASILVGYGVTRTVVNTGDGLTWLPDNKKGEVVQVNPAVGRPEARVKVAHAHPGDHLEVHQRGNQLVITDRNTGVVTAIDLATLQPGQHQDSRDVKTLLTDNRVYLAELDKGVLLRVLPGSSGVLGKVWRAPAGQMIDAAIDETGLIWVLQPSGDLTALTWTRTGFLERSNKSRTISDVDAASVLVAHDSGVTVLNPNGRTVTSIGTGSENDHTLPEIKGRLRAADSSPATLVPASAPDSAIVILIRDDHVVAVNMASINCRRPQQPAVYRGLVYVPCADTGKVVILNRDGHRAGNDIQAPGTGTPELIADDGRLLISSPNADTAQVVNPDGSVHTVRIHDGKLPLTNPQPSDSPTTPRASGEAFPPTHAHTPPARHTSSPGPRRPRHRPTNSPTNSPTGPPPEQSPNPEYYETIASSFSGNCVGVQNDSHDDGASIVQVENDPNSCQPGSLSTGAEWSWVGGYGQDGSSYKIVNQNSGLCLEPAGADEGAAVVQKRCADSGGRQLWDRGYQVTTRGWDYWWISNVATGLAPFQASDSVGASLILSDCSSGKWRQGCQWRTPVGGPT